MKFRIIKNRKLIEDDNFVGYQKENRAEMLEFDFPTEYSEYTKKINFSTKDGNYTDIITGNTYKLTNSLTKYSNVDFYIEFVKPLEDDKVEIVKTSVASLKFKYSFEADEEITEEEIDIINTLVANVTEATNRANAISEDLEEKVATDYYRGEKGEMGDCYFATFEFEDGNLIMNKAEEMEDINFYIEDGNLGVEING